MKRRDFLAGTAVGMAAWSRLPPAMQRFVETEVHVYSDLHHAAIQQADQEAWAHFEDAGRVITRLSADDVARFTKLAIPLWFKWANKDQGAAKVFKAQLDYMMSGSLGYVTPGDIAGHALRGI